MYCEIQLLLTAGVARFVDELNLDRFLEYLCKKDYKYNRVRVFGVVLTL